jgi:LacI family transcriptional regulator
LCADLENNIPFEKNNLKQVAINPGKSDIEQALGELLQSDTPVDAVVFESNNIATSGLKYINSLPIEVSQDLAVISFEQNEMPDLFYAPVSFVRQPLEEMGQAAVDITATTC